MPFNDAMYMNSPESIGSISGFAPDLRNTPVSIIPGCTLATKRPGFSAAKNSSVFTIAIFEVMYAERPSVLAGGKLRAPAATPINDACVLLAVGRKAVAAMTTDLTFVWAMVLLLLIEGTSGSKGGGKRGKPRSFPSSRQDSLTRWK